MQERFQTTDLKNALETLRTGGLILYPTDTVWGLGCDALNPDAIEKLFRLKGRERDKSMIILLENEHQLQSYVREIPDVAYQLIEYSERPLTIIYSGAKNLPSELVAGDGTIAIRIVQEPFCAELIRRFRCPIVSTSANFSGLPTPATFSDIDPEIVEKADYVVEYNRESLEKRQPSIVMKLDPSGLFEFVRK